MLVPICAWLFSRPATEPSPCTQPSLFSYLDSLFPRSHITVSFGIHQTFSILAPLTSGPCNFLLWGSIIYTIRYLAASLASTQRCLKNTPISSHDNQKHLQALTNVSSGQKHPQLRKVYWFRLLFWHSPEKRAQRRYSFWNLVMFENGYFLLLYWKSGIEF